MHVKSNIKDKAFITKAQKQLVSIRSTIPMPIVKMLGIQEHDLLSWDMTVVDGKIKIVVKKVKD